MELGMATTCLDWRVLRRWSARQRQRQQNTATRPDRQACVAHGLVVSCLLMLDRRVTNFRSGLLCLSAVMRQQGQRHRNTICSTT